MSTAAVAAAGNSRRAGYNRTTTVWLRTRLRTTAWARTSGRRVAIWNRALAKRNSAAAGTAPVRDGNSPVEARSLGKAAVDKAGGTADGRCRSNRRDRRRAPVCWAVPKLQPAASRRPAVAAAKISRPTSERCRSSASETCVGSN